MTLLTASFTLVALAFGTVLLTPVVTGNNSNQGVSQFATPGTIIIVKETNPERRPGSLFFVEDFGFTNNIEAPNSFRLDHGQSMTFENVIPGLYRVTEDELAQTGGVGLTDLTTIDCADSDANGTSSSGSIGNRRATIILDEGETVTCTFTNTQRGVITIVKDSVPNESQDFGYSGDLGNFSLDDDADPTLSNFQTFPDLLPGTFNVAQSVLTGWDLSNISCDDADTFVDLGTMTATINLDPGQDITCIFTSNESGAVISQAQYEYIGNIFTLFSCSQTTNGTTSLCFAPAGGIPPLGSPNPFTSYTNSDRVTARLTLDDPLAPNLNLQDVRGLPGFRMTLNDGHQELTDSGLLFNGGEALISTDANGNIIEPWSIIKNCCLFPNNGISTLNWPISSGGRGVGDSGQLSGPAFVFPETQSDSGRVGSRQPGTWTFFPGPVQPRSAGAIVNVITKQGSNSFDNFNGPVSDVDFDAFTFTWGTRVGSAAARAETFFGRIPPNGTEVTPGLDVGAFAGAGDGLHVARAVAFRTYQYTGASPVKVSVNAEFSGTRYLNGTQDIFAEVAVVDGQVFDQTVPDDPTLWEDFFFNIPNKHTPSVNLFDLFNMRPADLFLPDVLASETFDPNLIPSDFSVAFSPSFTVNPGQRFTVLFDVAVSATPHCSPLGGCFWGSIHAMNSLSSAPNFFTDPSGNPITDITAIGGPFAGAGTSPVFDIPPTQTDVIVIRAGDALSFAVQASDADLTDTVNVEALNLPGSAVLTCNVPANPTICNFDWTPEIQDIGFQTVTFKATDDSDGLVRTHSVLIEVTSIHPPTADAGLDQTVAATSPAGAVVSLDGSGSSDPDNDLLIRSWSAPGISFDDPTSPTPTATFPVGVTTVTLVVNDGILDSAPDTVDITVTDPRLLVIYGNAGTTPDAYQLFIVTDNFLNSASAGGGLVFASSTSPNPFWDVVVTTLDVVSNNGGFDASISLTGTNQGSGEPVQIEVELDVQLPLPNGVITDTSVVLDSLSITNDAGTFGHCGDAAIGALPLGGNINDVPIPSPVTCPS